MSKKAVVNALRQFCQRYHSPRTEAKMESAKKIYMRKKDGTLSDKKFTWAYKCAKCGEYFAKVHLHHDPPVGKEPDFPYDTEELLEYIRRLLAPKEGWKVLCIPCHNKEHING